MRPAAAALPHQCLPAPFLTVRSLKIPNRLIRDAILDSEKYHSCPIESRLLFIELLLCADDYALVPISDVYLRRHTTVCEGKTAGQIAGFLLPLSEHDLIRPYDSAKGGRFAFIPNFDNRAQAIKPKWPLPPQGLDQGYISTAIAKSKKSGINKIEKNDMLDIRSPTAEGEGEGEGVSTFTLKDPQWSSSAPLCPQQKIVALWIKTLPGLQPPRSWGPERQKHLAARWRELVADEEFTDEASGLKWFEWFFEFIGKSPFLTGKVPGRDGKHPFTASLDWVVLPTNFAKIVDRRYHSKKAIA